ncbi:heme exporter protein CcmB [Legionella gresilensis]|uniref:heme exporter protein CcmB n=1 Tax=Legionella gresilensis TaxID=91823 RepID=UPI00104168DB|nr:heme exporter protein CcmB [Legionella gresilensis]
MLTSWQCFKRQFKRDLLLNMRQPRFLMNAILFFIMIVVFFPLTFPPNIDILKQVIPGIIWVAVLLAMLLASDRLFMQDYEEGVIEQWLTSGYSLTIIVSAKLAVHWLLTLLPLLIFCPFLALFFRFSGLELMILVSSLIVGTPAILALCSLAAAFSIKLQQKGIMMALILLPLTLPIMIFGSSSLEMFEFSQITGTLAILLAISLLCSCFLPFAIAAIIRISLTS